MKTTLRKKQSQHSVDYLPSSISQFSPLMLRYTKAIKGILNVSPVNTKYSKRCLKLWSSNLFLTCFPENERSSEKESISSMASFKRTPYLQFYFVGL